MFLLRRIKFPKHHQSVNKSVDRSHASRVSRNLLASFKTSVETGAVEPERKGDRLYQLKRHNDVVKEMMEDFNKKKLRLKKGIKSSNIMTHVEPTIGDLMKLDFKILQGSQDGDEKRLKLNPKSSFERIQQISQKLSKDNSLEKLVPSNVSFMNPNQSTTNKSIAVT